MTQAAANPSQLTLSSPLSKRAAHALRFFAMDAVENAQSGHPGMPMGMADIATVLWSNHLHFDANDPTWLNRDRFVLSNGHGSMLLYALLHLTGFAVSKQDLVNFRKKGSNTPGHPEYGHTPGVETTSGPLGQGIANAVGMAIAERQIAARFNQPNFNLIDHHTYVFLGDGDLMEGISHEACSLAGHLGLGRLIAFYDHNQITIDGPTSLAYTEDVALRFQSYGWHILVVDGHDQQAVSEAIDAASQQVDAPSLIICKTTIGWGSTKAGSESVHGGALGAKEIAEIRKSLDWTAEPFDVPNDVKAFWQQSSLRGKLEVQQWQARYQAYCQAFPEKAAELQHIQSRTAIDGNAMLKELSQRWLAHPPKTAATRIYSAEVVETLAEALPQMLCGSADLSQSNGVYPKGFQAIQKNQQGRFLHYGVREHAMAAIMNGMALYGGILPVGGTFATFSDYLRPALRLAALMRQQVIHVMTHDSIGLGEDGPTHQPVEHYAALRAMPNVRVYRPADALETAACWSTALSFSEGPSVLLLSRQAAPSVPGSNWEGVLKGGYVLRQAPEGLSEEVVLMGTGTELALAASAQQVLKTHQIGARVVSLPCWELFEQQDAEYQKQVLAWQVKCRVAIEAGVSFGWERYLGEAGIMLGVSDFGMSAPYEQIYEHFGLTVENIVASVLKQLKPEAT